MPGRRYTPEQFRAALEDPNVCTLADLCRALGLVPRGANYATLRDLGRRMDVDVDHLLAWRRLGCSDDQLRVAAEGAETFAEIAQRLGLPLEQRVRQMLRSRLERLGLPVPPRSIIFAQHGSMATPRGPSYTDDELAEALQRDDIHGYPDLCRVLGLKSLSATHQRLRKRAAELGLAIPPEWSRSGPRRPRGGGAPSRTYPEAAFRDAVKNALCMADAIRAMGDHPKASTWSRARLTVERFKIDTAHLRPREATRRHNRMSDEEFFIRGVRRSGESIKRRLLARGHPRWCEACRTSTWEGQPVPLEVDHIDGDPWNNLLENLRLLCPNCHALTRTYRGRNIGRVNGQPRYPSDVPDKGKPDPQCD